MRIQTFSKVNYTLEVGIKREDGYHNLESVVQTLSLCDYIDIEETRERINISCSDPSVPTDERNTVYKACELFLSTFQIDKSVNIHIEKNIPTQAGLGGGSGNASGVLVALNEIFETNLSKDALARMSAAIGSDCPLFIYGGSTLMTGRGEIVKPLQCLPKLYFIIIKPDSTVSTKEAYSELDKRENIVSKGFTKKIVSLQEKNELTKELLCAYMTNDFEILNKLDIFDLKMALINAGAKGALLCGSGSCVFGVFFDESERDKAFEKLKEYYKVYKAESVF